MKTFFFDIQRLFKNYSIPKGICTKVAHSKVWLKLWADLQLIY